MATEDQLERIPSNQHADDYSRTKTIAEVLVLQSNGQTTQNGDVLRTCAVRPPGIYGAGEQRHFFRFAGVLSFYKANIGDPECHTNWVHVDNLVNGHLLAAHGLSSDKKHIAAGQAYFITDGKSINNCLFFKPVIDGLGYEFPKLWIPFKIFWFLALLSELVHFIFKPFFTVVGVSRTEAYQIGLHHTVSCEKAKRQLCYEPVEHNLDDCVQHLRQLGYAKTDQINSSWTSSLIFKVILSISIIVVLIAVLL